MKLNVGVIFGGKSVEHEVSIITAIQAMEHIDKEKYEVYYEIETLNDIYKYKNELLNSLDKFIEKADA